MRIIGKNHPQLNILSLYFLSSKSPQVWQCLPWSEDVTGKTVPIIPLLTTGPQWWWKVGRCWRGLLFSQLHTVCWSPPVDQPPEVSPAAVGTAGETQTAGSLEEVVTIDDINMNITDYNNCLPSHCNPVFFPRCISEQNLTSYLSAGQSRPVWGKTN